MSTGLEFTGERLIPGTSAKELEIEHRARYHYAVRHVDGSRVLDLGCGLGYGTEILETRDRTIVVGLDSSPNAVFCAAAEYRGGARQFVIGDAQELPFRPSSFDSIVAIEVVEHVAHADALLKESARVLTGRGVLVLSTPNRVAYAAARERKPNPYHVREFDENELHEILSREFPFVNIVGQTVSEGQLFSCLNSEADSRTGLRGRKVEVQSIPWNGEHQVAQVPDYLVAVCKKGWRWRVLAGLKLRHWIIERPASFFMADAGFIGRLRESLASMQADLDEKREWAQRVDRELTERSRHVRRLQLELKEKLEWVRQLEQKDEARERRLEELQQKLEERTRWSRKLATALRECGATVESASLVGDVDDDPGDATRRSED